jgi:uncharacterized protein (DUF952 family)/N-acetylglutamate synthase-like GNAT family acetyltransferase
VILHLLSRDSWVEAQAHGQLIAPSVATEGFAHCSTEHQMVDVANKYYRGTSNMVLLNIDPTKLTSVLKFEPPAHLDGSPALPHEPLFPHIYGPINLNAVIEVIDFPSDEHGTFVAPPQLKTYSVVNITDTPQHWQRAAELSVSEWKEIFTDDSVQTYIDLYGQDGTYAGRFVETYVAVSADDELIGMATLVDDDELPNAPEPGPWLAAVLTVPTNRAQGVASAVVQRIVQRAHELKLPAIYLYTNDQQQWYANKGWKPLRETELNGIAHTVMCLSLLN